MEITSGSLAMSHISSGNPDLIDTIQEAITIYIILMTTTLHHDRAKGRKKSLLDIICSGQNDF